MRAPVDAIRTDLRDGRSELRGLGSEVTEIAESVRDLLRAEIALAKAETKEQGGHLARAAAWGGVAGAAALLTLAWVALASTYALSTALPLWLAALIVSATLAVLAGIAGLGARARAKKLSVLPRRAVNAVKEDVAWARQQLKSNST